MAIHGVVPLDVEGDIRLATYQGRCVTLISNQLKPLAIPLDYIGESAPCLAFAPDQTCMVYDFTYNARYSNLFEIGSLSECLERRICEEAVRQAEKLADSEGTVKPIDRASNVILDFGLRPAPFFQTNSNDKSSKAFLDPKVKHRRYPDAEDVDLDIEVDAINVAYLWSGFKWPENPKISRARKKLRSRLMGIESYSSDLQLHHAVLEMEDYLLKNVFIAVCIIEGFWESPLEVAEQGLYSTLHTLQAQHAEPSRMGVLVEFLLAKVQVQKQQSFARERMLRLANTGNLFAQVFISRHFASSLQAGVIHADQVFDKKFTRTGYGVSECLPPLYNLLGSSEKPDFFSKHLKNLAKRSAGCGNPVGKALWITRKRIIGGRKTDVPSEYFALAGALGYLSGDLYQAHVWFDLAGLDVALAFVNMANETEPTAIVSWLTCMDCCWPEHYDLHQSLWFQLISDKVLEAKINYSLLMFGLDEDSVLATMNFTRLQTLEKLYYTSRVMDSEELGDRFMRKIRDKYLDARGLRMLGGIYRSNNNLEAAIDCYTIAGDSMNCAEAMLDAAVGHLEIGKVGRALGWAERAGFPYQLLVSGIAPGFMGRGETIEGFKVAAEAGDPRAMWFLGELMSSRKWLVCAAESGFHEALVSMQDLSKYSGNVDDFWRLKEEEMLVRRLWSGFTGRVDASDAAIACAFKRCWM